MSHVSRRRLMGTGLGALGMALAGCALAKPDVKTDAKSSDFVTVEGIHFKLKGETYRYVGANIWYGAYLGSAASFGDRTRLIKELDDLKALGVINLRVLASSELSPLINSLDPAFSNKPGDYNSDLLTGLDFLLAEMHKRDMKAVLYLTNFWEWSGGMVTYQYWTNGGQYINAGDPAHPWPAFADFSSQFYASGAARQAYYDYIKMLLARTNSISGTPYKNETAIMAWQLSNEPRPGGSAASVKKNVADYYGWIKDSAALIRSLAPNHLVSLGHEGLMGANNSEEIVIKAHEHIDYLTAHIWPQNWSWVDGKNLKGTFGAGAAKVQTYIDAHIAIAKTINKPLVFEEFGFPRDDVAYEPGTPTTYKDKFYGLIYKAVEDAIAHNTPVAGSNFWAWGGAGRALHSDYHMLRGETAYVGDPPHEPQGWYSVFNTDTSTQALIKTHGQHLINIKS
ncbi:glycoside hydrolase 5 family protein [Asticcacaulis benevestitus]|uniref:mannan endo-1,4-beta-mannosidase n=1 Tax=Asticcacaulis benevestitus DSM 16100 = ATCC BAA-896 TaxID=1121022 RepID=V4Q8R3_9CAUL|nr:mannanase [Asticcacaulis benevestitus]ESQ94255.1 mannanase [Asticcacaulis benevestitus DSM 16100 = ATCC BAA-896]